jgi:hypothetical protein
MVKKDESNRSYRININVHIFIRVKYATDDGELSYLSKFDRVQRREKYLKIKETIPK